ncbi:uncharacterized protein LOC117105102 [Anneissia japonica]|uniref:uncharacterized protein LOC117105102 n=1 Tax=Anneissia japonica TaxID=1529436 RepID=UPI0014257700|nr:uncharacterized protein LOC117105102 [Anneissia japonica]
MLSMEKLQEFLKNRGLSTVFERFQEDKIDGKVILELTDEELKDYVPVKGDRVSLRVFARKQEGETSAECRKLELLKALQPKARQKNTDNHTSQKQSLIASKTDCAITVGFCLSIGDSFRQVRAPLGGGIRQIRVSKELKKNKLIERIVPLFFPNGKNCKGSVDDFVFDLATDVTGNQFISDDESVQQVIQRLGLKHLRCYLVASSHDTDTSDELPDIVFNETSTFHEQHTNEKEDVIIINDKMTEPLPALALEESDLASNLSAQSPPLSPIHDNQSPVYNIPTEFIEEDTLAWLDQSEVQFPSYSNMADINDTLSIVKEIKLHRGNVFQDFVDFFSLEENRNCRTTTFEAKMVKGNGEIEIAEDNGGVMRDALSEFYQTFYLQCTTGNTVSVPVLRHDMDSTHWGAVAEVLHLAYRQEHMFPVKIAMPFMQQVLFGQGNNPMEAFMQMIPDCDRVLLEDALASNSFSSVDEEEFLDLMSRHDSKRIPTDAASLKIVLTEIAHKEIIQMPMFVADCWSRILKTLNIAPDDLDKIYRQLKPSTKRVLKMFQFPDSMSADENNLASFLKRLVREMDMSHLPLFLRFCTGADMTVQDKISVRFTETTIRCPTAHTCGCVLEIPRLYAAEPFMTFKSEFLTLLQNRYWQMDIV